jgi:cell division septal protein FtsQ
MGAVSTASVAIPRRTRTRIRVLRRRFVVVALLATGLISAYMFWFRDSSLVAVKTVKVEGIGSGKLDTRLEQALTGAGLEMTTLHVDHRAIAQAASEFPLVESVSADPSFPSTLTVEVTKRRPAGLIGDGSDAVAVAGDGTILRGLPTGHLEDLPALPLAEPPKGDRLEGPALEQAEILGAAPPALLRYVEDSWNGPNGVGVTLDGGVELGFADASHAAQKWHAAAAVLSDPDLGPLDYVDLSFPGRPAVGGVGHSPPPIASG